jgi:hypothetical protein
MGDEGEADTISPNADRLDSPSLARPIFSQNLNWINRSNTELYQLRYCGSDNSSNSLGILFETDMSIPTIIHTPPTPFSNQPMPLTSAAPPSPPPFPILVCTTQWRVEHRRYPLTCNSSDSGYAPQTESSLDLPDLASLGLTPNSPTGSIDLASAIAAREILETQEESRRCGEWLNAALAYGESEREI